MARPRAQRGPISPLTVLATAMVVSALAHVAAAWWLWDKPVVRFNPELFEPARSTYRVVRAERDKIIGEPGDAGKLADPPSPAPTLAQMSRALLQEAPAVREPSRDEPALVRMRELPDALPEAFATPLQLPDIVLPAGVVADLPSGPAAMAFVPESGASGEGATVGMGSGAAARMLAGAGLAVGLSEPRRFTMTESGPVDQRRLDAPLDAPPIDFVDLALDPTTQLDLPEHLDDDFDYYLKTFTDRDGAGYFQIDIVARRSLRKLRTMPKDVVFLVDISGSIPQEFVTEVVAGLTDALGSLNEGDRFNIVMFRETARFFSTQGIQPATASNVEAARAFLVGTKAGGYTDINRALSQLLVRDLQAPRVYELILITDGHPTKGVQDTRQLINIVTRDNEMTASIYSVGIGRAPNVELLEFLSYRNKGLCVFANRPEAVAPTIRDLMSRLRYPIIKDVQLSVVGLEGGEVYPLHLPNIHSGESFQVFGRYPRPDQFMMRVTGRGADRNVDFTFSRDLAAAPQGDAAIRQGWAFWKLHHLYSEMIRQGETRELLRQIEQMRRQYKLKTLY